MSKLIDDYLFRIYCRLSPFYIRSFSSTKHGSIYNYHTSFFLLDNHPHKYFKSNLPREEKICFLLLIFVTFYYATSGFDLIHYSDTIEFLVGDFNLITEVKYGSLRRIYSSFVMFALITIGFTIYQSFNTEISKAFRTFIMYSYEYETNNKILDKFVANEIEFSRSTVILFDYLRQRFDPKFVEFKSSFNKFYCLARLVHCKFNYIFGLKFCLIFNYFYFYKQLRSIV